MMTMCYLSYYMITYCLCILHVLWLLGHLISYERTYYCPILFFLCLPSFKIFSYKCKCITGRRTSCHESVGISAIKNFLQQIASKLQLRFEVHYNIIWNLTSYIVHVYGKEAVCDSVDSNDWATYITNNRWTSQRILKESRTPYSH